jgi:UDP-N-acetylmuramate dehydrogenase
VLPEDVPVLPVGIGSNLLVRDGGIPGVVIRLSAKGFGRAEQVSDTRLAAGAVCPDKHLAALALETGLGGFHFYHGIPGAIGGALRMNAGANGVETRERVVEVHAIDRKGERHVLSNADMGYAYRHSSAPKDLIFTRAIFEGVPADKDEIRAGHGRRAASPRDGAADPREDRRLDLQESGRPFGLEGDRRGRLPRTDRGWRADVADALQFHDQHRHGFGLRARKSGRNRPRPGAGKLRHRLEWEIKRLGLFEPEHVVQEFLGQMV